MSDGAIKAIQLQNRQLRKDVESQQQYIHFLLNRIAELEKQLENLDCDQDHLA